MSLKGRCYDNDHTSLLLDWELAVELMVNKTQVDWTRVSWARVNRTRVDRRREEIIRGTFFCTLKHDNES